jgi:probable rRNA maturation factor
MVEVVNRQRAKKIATAPWLDRTNEMLEAIGKAGSSVTIAFISDRKMRDLNSQFRGIDKATDVLSFPTGQASDDLGEIAISVETAARQAKDNGLTLNGEISQLILHGLLHLSGYDHETDNGEMNRLELKFRRKLGI